MSPDLDRLIRLQAIETQTAEARTALEALDRESLEAGLNAEVKTALNRLKKK